MDADDLRILKVIGKLSSRERKLMDAYIQMKGQPKDSLASRLWRMIQPDEGSAQDEGALQVEDLYTKAFPDEAWSAVRWKNACHSLVSLWWEFQAWRALLQDKAQLAIYQVANGFERFPVEEAERIWARRDHALSRITEWERDAEWYKQRERLGMLLVDSRSDANGGRGDYFLEEALRRLEERYVMDRLRLECALLNQQQIFGNLRGDRGNLGQAEDRTSPDRNLVTLYHHLKGCVITSTDCELYDRFMSKYAPEFPKMGQEVRLEVIGYCLNWCIRGINSGSREAEERYIALYKDSVPDDRAQLFSGSPGQCKNLVQMALRRNSMDIAESVAKDAEKFGAEALGHRMVIDALIAMYKWKLDAMAAAIGKGHAVLDRFLEFDIRVLKLLHSVAAQDEYDFAGIAALRRSVNRDRKMSEAHRKRYANFLAFMDMLADEYPRSEVEWSRLLQRLRGVQRWKKQIWILEWICSRPQKL